MIDRQRTIKCNKHIYYYFSSCLRIYHRFSFFVVDNTRCFNDGKALERLGQLELPIAAVHPDGIPLERVGFRVSRDLAGMLCIALSVRLLRRRILRIALITEGT